MATDGKIRTDMKTFKIAVIQAKRSKIDEIANDPNIKAVSVDQVVYALEEEEDEEEEEADLWDYLYIKATTTNTHTNQI